MVINLDQNQIYEIAAIKPCFLEREYPAGCKLSRGLPGQGTNSCKLL